MKKILVMLIMLVAMPAFSAVDWSSKSNYKLVNDVGKRLLTKNDIPAKINFRVKRTKQVNAHADQNDDIYVYAGLLEYVDNEDELAAVIAHEIAHVVNRHIAKSMLIQTAASALIYVATNGESGGSVTPAGDLAMLKLSRTYEYESDATAVDLLVNAGYNPLAMISFLQSLSSGGKSIDVFSTHPANNKRTMQAYDYICYKYPEKMTGYSSDSYEEFLEYATPIVEARNANPEKLAKFNKKQEKRAKKRAEKMVKYKQKSLLQKAADKKRNKTGAKK